MEDEGKIKELLVKQCQLLFEKSSKCEDIEELRKLTQSMIDINDSTKQLYI